MKLKDIYQQSEQTTRALCLLMNAKSLIERANSGQPIVPLALSYWLHDFKDVFPDED